MRFGADHATKQDPLGGRWSLVKPSIGRPVAVMLGIILGQIILYGPSLTGEKILLPLDLLARPHVYLPATPGAPAIVPHNQVLSDLVLIAEPARRFMTEELHAGRWPLLAPYQLAGVPFNWPKHCLLSCCVTSPVALAWSSMAMALMAGAGAYLFCRKVLRVGFWPATLTSWCFPLTGFFVFWQGYSHPATVLWLPWMLLAVDKTVRGPGWWGGPAVALVTCSALVFGQPDVAGQLLLASGFYAVWCCFDEFYKQWINWRALRNMAALVLGWALGFMLAAPHMLPLLEYSRSGSRMMRRTAGEEERPPVGFGALPQTILPDMYGSDQSDRIRFAEGNQLESSASAYAGLLATLLCAPLAWCSRRHRSVNFFWVILAVIALAWALNLIGLVTLLRMPPLNLMSHNRFVFAATFGVLALMAVGLNVLDRGVLRRRWWFWLPITLATGVCGWCVYRAVVAPTAMEDLLAKAQSSHWVTDLWVRDARWNFSKSYIMAATLSGLALAGWLVLWFRAKRPRWLVPAVGCLLMADLLWFGYDRAAQCDPVLYFPPIKALEEVGRSTPGRIIGFNCLPANLAQSHHLCDIRGYDAVDPARLTDLLMIAADPRSPKIPYAMTQWLLPRLEIRQSGTIRIHPILNMLNVRYVVFRGNPPENISPDFVSDDYWIMTNRLAAPRVYVPERVETVADDHERLLKLADVNFDPQAVAYVESLTGLSGRCSGTAEVVSEVPCRVTVSVTMRTPGLVVLADLWDQGWAATLNGQAVPILRVNHAIRGVELPAGQATLEFRYEPASLTWGLRVAGLAFIVAVGWAVAGYRRAAAPRT